MQDWSQYIAAGLPTVAVLLSIWRADKRADLADTRMHRLETRMDAGFAKVDTRFEKVDGRLERFEDRIDKRFDKVDADFRHLFELYGLHDEAIETLKKRVG
jgi:hypothetical protein